MTPRNEIIFVAGKDPIAGAGGHDHYVRVHAMAAMAAMAAGWQAHLFCVGHHEDVVDTPFGRVHRIRSPFAWFYRRDPSGDFRTPWIPFHAPLIHRRIKSHLRSRTGRFVIHGFGLYGAVGARLRREQNPGEAEIVAIVSQYSTSEHEFDAKRRGITREHGVMGWLTAQFEYYWMKLAATRFERRSVEHSDVILVNYDSVTHLFREAWPLPSSPVKVPYTSEAAFLPAPAPDGVPVELSRLKATDAPLIVSVSRHDPRKGVDVLIKAFAELLRRGIRFRACVLSHGPLLEAHRRLARKLGLDDVVAITGRVADPTVYLAAADIFVLPSLQEGSGSLSLIDALRGGLAVVASDVDGIPEDVSDRDSALLVPPGDVVALSSALGEVLENEELRSRLQERARAVFEEKFAPQLLTDRLSDIYRGLLDAP